MDPAPAPESTPTELESPAEAVAALTDKVWGWGETLVLMLPNLLIALVVLGLAWIAAQLAAAGVRRAFAHVLHNVQLMNLVTMVVRTAVMIAGLFLALSVLELDKTVTSLLAGVGVVGIALGFAFQDIAANFMSGVLIVSNRPFEIGDWVDLAGHEGTVRAIDLRSVTIQRFSGESVQIPNKDVFQNAIVNYDTTGVRRVEVSVGVGYDSDLDQVRRVALEVLGPHNRVPDKSVDALVTGFGDSSIDLSLRFWISTRDDEGLLRRKSAAMIDVKRAFDDHGIDIPFPIRTLYGGSPLTLTAARPDEESVAAK